MKDPQIFTLIMLAGCSSATYVGPIDGQPAYKIDCSNLTSCREKAKDVCGGDFEERKVVNDGQQQQAGEERAAIVAVCR